MFTNIWFLAPCHFWITTQPAYTLQSGYLDEGCIWGEKKKSEGHTVSGLHISVYTGLHEYTGTVFPTRDDWRLSWDAGEQLGSGKIKGCMSFSHTSHISCLVCWLMFICRCTFIPSWDRKKVYFFLFQWEMIAHWNFKILQAKKHVSWWEFIGIIQILE